MSVRKMFPSGGWEVSAVVDNTLVSRVYFGFSRAESVALFSSEIKKLGFDVLEK